MKPGKRVKGYFKSFKYTQEQSLKKATKCNDLLIGLLNMERHLTGSVGKPHLYFVIQETYEVMDTFVDSLHDAIYESEKIEDEFESPLIFGRSAWRRMCESNETW